MLKPFVEDYFILQIYLFCKSERGQVPYPGSVGKLDRAAGSPDSIADTLAVPSYLHLILPVDVYVMKGLMMQFHEVHKQLCCTSGVEAARGARGRASPEVFDCDFQQGHSQPLGGVAFLLLLAVF